MDSDNSRMRRERKTVEAMVRIYCRRTHHRGRGLCGECSSLLEYSFNMLDKCPLSEDKPTCAKCTIHCYRPEERERLRTVMRYSGPRMILHHPALAILHMVDSRKSHSTRGKR